MYLAMKVRESVGRRTKPAVRPRKFATQINTQDLINRGLSNGLSHWVKHQWLFFHTLSCRCEGVGRDSGCRHEESHLMYI